VFHTFTVYLVYLKQILRYSSLAYIHERVKYLEQNAESAFRNRSFVDNGRPGQEALINA